MRSNPLIETTANYASIATRPNSLCLLPSLSQERIRHYFICAQIFSLATFGHLGPAQGDAHWTCTKRWIGTDFAKSVCGKIIEANNVQNGVRRLSLLVVSSASKVNKVIFDPNIEV